jgi:tripartite-type tricarboxylate transporter receptor subunit TctC
MALLSGDGIRGAAELYLNCGGPSAMMFDRRSLIGSIALLLAETRGQAQPQSTANSGDWPVRSVRFIVPAAAGSAGDDISRLIAAKLSERFGQQFFIVNQPAAVGTLAMQDLVRAIPDGYTIGQISVSTQVIAKLYNPSLPYDGIKDFALISLLGSSPYVLAVNPGVPGKNVAELVALAKAKRQPLSNAAFGTMSLGYLASKLFEREAGIRLNQIPYRSSAQAVVDVVAGRVDMQFSTLPPAVPLIKTGKLRAIATTGAQRVATLAEVPTLAESGYPGFDVALWLGMAAPLGMPAQVVARLNSELVALLNTADMRDAMLRQSFIAKSSAPDELARRIESDVVKWRDLVATAGSEKN